MQIEDNLIPIIYENDNFLVVNKPVDIAMHGPGSGIITLLEKQIQSAKLYLVHRLDTATSGCLLIAKNKQSAADLSALFAKRLVQKYYLALSDKKPRKKQGKLSGDMHSTRGGNYKLSNTANNPAITFFFSHSMTINAQNFRFFYLKPITGKTHQLRVALKTLNSPIIGDKRYKGSMNDRMYLHSHALGFMYKEEKYLIKSLPQTGGLFEQIDWQAVEDIESLAWPKFTMPTNMAISENHQ